MQLKITPIKRDQKIGWVHETTNEEEAKCREDVGSRDEDIRPAEVCNLGVEHCKRLYFHCFFDTDTS